MAALATHSRSRGRGGFTILELLLSLVAVAALATLAIPFHFDSADVSLENAAIQLAADLRMAQNRAAYLGRAVTLEFDADGHGYRMVEQVSRGPRVELVRRYDADGVFEGVRVRSAAFGSEGALARFGTRGSALSGGRVQLALHDEVRTLSLQADTGRLAIEDSSSGWVDDGL